MIIAAALALGWTSAARAIDFPATGQTTAYPAEKRDGILGAVAVPDDGTVQAGAPLSFTDNGDGTITDNNTGLMWEKKSDEGGLHDKDRNYPWSRGTATVDTVWDWLDDVNAEGGTGFAGYDDWRLPNAKELESLVNYENPSPRVARAFNNNCLAGGTVLTGSCTADAVYWSSTTWARSTSMAWYVSFWDVDGGLSVSVKVTGNRVRAVRGGSSGPGAFPATGQITTYPADKNDGIPGPVTVPDDGMIRAGAPLSFTDNGNGTITDNNTGLVWEKKSDDGDFLHDKDNIYWWSGNSAQETIWDWLEDVNSTTFGGHKDWRIPNARELLSIVDFQHEWAVPAAFNTNCVPGATVLTGSCSFQSYWTSTSQNDSLALSVDNYGALTKGFKSSTDRVRAVRGE
jgi:Protein of unknown function (DUF1566)